MKRLGPAVDFKRFLISRNQSGPNKEPVQWSQTYPVNVFLGNAYNLHFAVNYILYIKAGETRTFL